MAKFPRVFQKIFGSTAGADQIGKFGSLAAGTPQTTTDPAAVMSLANYLGGWFEAILGNNSPAIEDMNGLHFMQTYQLAYLFQNGIADWDASTTYFKGSTCLVGEQLYISRTDTNVNNSPASSPTNWRNADVPAGAMQPYGGATAPTGYLLCQGQSLLRADYAHLFAAIGTSFGAADGTHFTLPDMSRRVPMGAGGSGTGTIGNTVGSVGGEEGHILTTAELASHSHTITDPGHSHSVGAVEAVASAGGLVAATGSGTIKGPVALSIGNSATGITGTNNAGSGTAHNTIQPSIIFNYIIKT